MSERQKIKYTTKLMVLASAMMALSRRISLPARSAAPLIFNWSCIDSSPVYGGDSGGAYYCRSDRHKPPAGYVVSGHLRAQIGCSEFFIQEVGEDSYTEDDATINSSLFSVELINALQGLLKYEKSPLLVGGGEVLKEYEA